MKTEIVSKKVQYNKLYLFTHRHFMFSVRFITPTRIANVGNIVGDYVTVALTVAGIILSIITMTKKQRRRGLLFFHSYCPHHSLYFGSSRLF